jgi:hypothetical protein
VYHRAIDVRRAILQGGLRHVFASIAALRSS